MTEASALKDILAAADAAAAEIALTPPLTLRRSEATDMEKLMATGARLLRQKIDEHITAVSAYDKARTDLLDTYRVQIERSRIECEDRLRKLELDHKVHLDSVEALITKLKTLREA